MQSKYPVASISRHRLGIDGQGIRTLIVMQECPLRCKYCINPFTWNGERKATLMTVQELFDKVNIDRLYMLATGGGLTFGGGEPLLYPDLIKEMRELCDPKLSFTVETSFNVPWNNIEKVISSVDEFVVDIKTTDAARYRVYTGGNLYVANSNLRELIRRIGASKVVVRIPIIPGFTDENDQNASKRYLQTIGIERFNLFRYRVKEKEEPLGDDEESIILGEETPFWDIEEEMAILGEEKPFEDAEDGMAILGEAEPDERLEMHIDELGFSNRTRFILGKAGIDTVYDLIMHSPKELMKIRFMENLDEIVAKLEELGLQLRKDDENEV